MQPEPNISAERRYYNRTEIECAVAYRPFKQEEYKQAVLINISETGALIAVNEKLGIDAQIFLKLESTDENEQPIQMLAETVRSSERLNGYEYCYGCMILDVFY